jgi:alanyl-tRNA synthetase
LGKDIVTIDFTHDIAPTDLPSIEAQANAFIWSDTPINIRFLEGEALKQAEYRSKKFIPGLVRLVAFPGADCCACCGTHVERAGQVGLVKLLSCQKFREGVRMELLCGKRAFDYLSGTWEQNLAVSRALSAKPLQTHAAVERLKGELESVKLRAATLETADFARKGAEYAGKGDVVLFEGDMSSDSVRRLCDAVLDTCGGRCAVFAGEDGNFKYAVGIRDGDIRPLVKELNGALNGRGGGKPNFAQGSVAAKEADIKAFFETK